MKVIFLDFDGVLNSTQSAYFWHNKRDQEKWENELYDSWKGTLKEYLAQEFCPIAVSNVEELMRLMPEAKVVISSTWRIGETVESLKKIVYPAKLISDAIVGVTPFLLDKEGYHVRRGLEIQRWLDGHPEVTEFVIIDDDNDMEHLTPYLVQIDSQHGFLYKDIFKAIKILRKEDLSV